MKKLTKGAAKRLIFSLVALSALSGCAVYGPPPGPYAYSTDAYGQPVYATAPPVYAAPYYYNPVYVGPPVALSFGFGFHSGGGRGYRGGGGYGGHGGHGGHR